MFIYLFTLRNLLIRILLALHSVFKMADNRGVHEVINSDTTAGSHHADHSDWKAVSFTHVEYHKGIFLKEEKVDWSLHIKHELTDTERVPDCTFAFL